MTIIQSIHVICRGRLETDAFGSLKTSVRQEGVSMTTPYG